MDWKAVMRGIATVLVVSGLSGCAPAPLQTDAKSSGADAPAQVSGGLTARVASPAANPHASGAVYRPPSTGVRAQAFVPERAGRVFIFAGVDDACRALPAPQVTVTRAPSKGEVSFRPGQETTLTASVGGSCIGSKATGTGIYYTARSGSRGSDTFNVSAKLASGETMTREFSVEIAE